MRKKILDKIKELDRINETTFLMGDLSARDTCDEISNLLDEARKNKSLSIEDYQDISVDLQLALNRIREVKENIRNIVRSN
jgi:hypothetical protein